MEVPVLHTPRLLLRPWRPEDLGPFARMSADPRVMEHFPRRLDADEAAAVVERICAQFARDGFGLWAVEVKGGLPFIGFVGLNVPAFSAHFTPCVEIGWRLMAEAWGQGYATEGARAALAFGFEEKLLEEIVSFTVPANTRSRAVMAKLGMQHAPAEDFDHPGLPGGHPLRRHVLYRLGRSRWRSATAASALRRS